jgi:hypothetical protein
MCRPSLSRTVGSSSVHPSPSIFYLAVGGGGLGATLVTRFETRLPEERDMLPFIVGFR